METLASASSSKIVVLGYSTNPQRDVYSQSLFGLIRKPNSIATTRICRRKASSFSVKSQSSNSAPIRINKLQEKLPNRCFASIFSSRGKETSSIAVNPQPSMSPPPPSQVESPLFWIGVGVGLSALFSWVVKRAKNLAMQLAFKSLMGQMDSQNNQFNNAPFSTGSNFPFPAPPSSSPPTSSSPVASREVTVDIPATQVEASPTTAVNEDRELRPKSNKSGIK